MRIIEREITTTKEGRPVMVLKPIEKYDKTYIDGTTGRPYKKRSFIYLDKKDDAHTALWEYSEKHNPEGFLELLTSKAIYLCQLFCIEVPKKKRQFTQMMISISDTITNGIDDLVKTPPKATEESRIIRVRPTGIFDEAGSLRMH